MCRRQQVIAEFLRRNNSRISIEDDHNSSLAVNPTLSQCALTECCTEYNLLVQEKTQVKTDCRRHNDDGKTREIIDEKSLRPHLSP